MSVSESYSLMVNNITKAFMQDYMERNISLPHSMLLSGFTLELQMRDIYLSCIVMLDVG